MFKRNWIFILFLVILILITYANSLNNAFLSDDLAEIVNNPKVGDLSSIFTRPFGFIRLIVYWAAYHIGGLNPAVFRFTNFLFHIGSTITIFFILVKLYRSRLIAFLAAAIFAVHPAFAEAVVWISGGMYPQYSFFLLLSFYFYISSEKKALFYWASVVFFLFSFMSHPVMPAGLFLIFPLYDLCFGNLKKHWIKSIPFLLILVAYIFINLGALSERESTLQTVHYQERGVDNIFIIIPIALSSYFELIFWPQTLTLYHSELFFNTYIFILRASVTLLFFAAAIFAFFKNKSIFFWLAFFFLALSPTLTPFRLNWIMAERYLYLASLGIIIPFVLLLKKVYKLSDKFKMVVLVLSIIIISLLSIRTIFRNIDWKNEDNLWIATGKTSPSSPNTHNNLGDVYGRWGDKQRSLQEFLYAIQLKEDYADAYHNAGNVYKELGQNDKALEYYQKAASLSPVLWQSYQNMAAIYFEMQQYDKAIEAIQKGISINPKNPNILSNLGVIYLTMNDKEKAKEIFMQVLTMDPQNQYARAGLIEANK
ncbi:MAG: tetratricopeptide repeat protein [Candidatus Daviesbacteria bacterium]|nr:tetratricopeptide repeat protein [Candidatus Daviesbacteria bacterium]